LLAGICSELVSSAKSPKSAEFAQKHTNSKLSIATVNQSIVKKPHLFSRVDFSRLLLFFSFFIPFSRVRRNQLLSSLSCPSSLFLFCVRRQRFVEEVKVEKKPVIQEKPVPLDL